MRKTETLAREDAKKRLPKDWQWIPLEEVVRPHNGYWGQESPFPGSTEVTVIGVGNILNDGGIQLNGAQRRHLAAKETEAIAREGDLLVVKSSGSATNIRSGKTGLCSADLSGKIACSNFLIRLSVFREKADPYLLWLILNSNIAKAYIREIAASTTYPNIKWSTYKDLAFPLPPLFEQKRLAAILTEQLAAVDRARAAAEEQLAAARALPAGYLRAVFDNTEAKKWPKKKLGELLHLRKEIVHPQDNPKGLATFVGLEHIESGTGIRTSSINVEMSELTGRKPRFYKGDIVYGYLRPYLNKVWVADIEGLCSVDQYVYAVDSAKADTDFVAWFMRSPTYLKRAPINTTPGQLPRIRTEEVASVDINLPSLSEQHRIITHLFKQLRAVEEARGALEEQLDIINKLPTALLRRAFNGQL